MHFSRFSFFLLKENPFFFSSMPVAFFNLLLTLFWVGGRNKGIRGWLLQIYKLNAKKGWFFLEPLLCCVPHLCSFKSLMGYFSVPGRIFFVLIDIERFRVPTSNALLISFLLSSVAEILSIRIGAKCAKTCMRRGHIPTELPFCIAQLVVGFFFLKRGEVSFFLWSSWSEWNSWFVFGTPQEKVVLQFLCHFDYALFVLWHKLKKKRCCCRNFMR